MLAKIQSCAVIGLEGALVEVEVDLSNGLAAFTIVGLPDAAVNESRERVRSAIKNSGCLCKLFHSIRYFFDNYLTYIRACLLQVKVFRSACEALSIAAEKERQYCYYLR